jgi:two-component system, OmpR family, phosphate regulon response regulator PhoB
MLILVVEDDPDIREMVCQSLQQGDLEVIGCLDHQGAKQAIKKHTPDCLVVDWMLPDRSGLDLIRWMRKQDYYQHVPVLMLTARTEENDMLTGLESGADDYLTKPMSLRELNARVKALLRRPAVYQEQVHVLKYGQLSLNSRTYEVFADDRPVELNKTGFRILRLLMENPKTVFTREQILDKVWGINTFLADRTVDVHILRLRKLLKLHCVEDTIATIRGVGYCMAKDIYK